MQQAIGGSCSCSGAARWRRAGGGGSGSRRGEAPVVRASRRQQQQQQQEHQQHMPPAAGGVAGALAALQVLAAAAAAPLLPLAVLPPPPAHAVLSSPNARIPRSAEAALRRSIPAFNPDVAAVQKALEEVAYLLRIPQRKPWGNMASDVAASLARFDAAERRAALLAGVPPDQAPQAEQALDALYAKLKQLELAVKTQQADFTDARVADCLRLVADLELLQAPGLAFSVPREWADRPTLRGRATVELTVEKADGSLAFVDGARGGLTARGVVRLTLDGYSAPVSAGSFALNVRDGLYDNAAVSASYASVVVGRGDGARSRAAAPRRPVPLENLPAGEFDALYKLPLDVAGGELPVLPLSIPGAASFARLDPGIAAADELPPSGAPADGYLSGEQFFLFKFDKQQAGLSGLAFDEGQFGVFAYVTQGMDVVKALQTGDVVVSARLVAGADRLVVPQEAAAAAAAAVAAPAPAVAVESQ